MIDGEIETIETIETEMDTGRVREESEKHDGRQAERDYYKTCCTAGRI